MFLAFIAATLGITYWAARRSSGESAYFAAGRRITGWQNGLAISGDYMSAASFLGIAGLIAFYGFDGFMYSVGFLVAYLTVLFLVAEPLRNAGKYTMADVLAYRLRARPVRAWASLSTLTVSTFYMIAQMVGAGALVSLLLADSGISFTGAVTGVGILMIVYVVFGGMLATTWVQIVKAVLLMSGTFLLSVLVLAHFGFDLGAFFAAAGQVSYQADGQTVTQNFLTPGLYYKPPHGALDLISLGMALIFGTAGLPHILIRFYTVPDAKTARVSVFWAMLLIGAFYMMTTFLGFGARGNDRGPQRHLVQRRHQHERPAVGPSPGRRRLLRLHLRRGLRDDPGRRGRADHQRLDLVRARFLHQRHPPRQGALARRRSARSSLDRSRRRRGLHRHRHRLGPDPTATSRSSWDWPLPWRHRPTCR